MTTLQKGVLWMTGCLIFTFVLSIGLAWYASGYLDVHTVGILAAMMLPILAVATGVLIGAEHRAERSSPRAPVTHKGLPGESRRVRGGPFRLPLGSGFPRQERRTAEVARGERVVR